MGSRKVELTVDPGKITAWVSLAALVAGLAIWVFKADASHDQTVDNRTAIEILVDDKTFKDRLYGENYEQKIMDILDKDERRRTKKLIETATGAVEP